MAYVLVLVKHMDIRRARAIRLASQRPSERRMLDGAKEEDLLPWLDVRANPHAQLCVTL